MTDGPEAVRALLAGDGVPPAAGIFLALATVWADGRLSERGVTRTLLAAHAVAEAAPERQVHGVEVACRARALRTEDKGRSSRRLLPLRDSAIEDDAPSALEELVAAEDLRLLRADLADRLRQVRALSTPAERRALRRRWRGWREAGPSESSRPLSLADRVAYSRLRDRCNAEAGAPALR